MDEVHELWERRGRSSCSEKSFSCSSWCILLQPMATAWGSAIPMWTQRISSGTLSLVRRENSCAQCILSLMLCGNHETRIRCDDDENEFRAEAYEFDAPVLPAIRYYFLFSLFLSFSLLMVSTRSCDRHAHMANHKKEKSKRGKSTQSLDLVMNSCERKEVSASWGSRNGSGECLNLIINNERHRRRRRRGSREWKSVFAGKT